MRKRGIKVQPFKCGPDYIDPGYLSLAAGAPCRNLDSWLLPEDSLKETFLHAALKSQVAVVEGVMGLYDGRGGSVSGSTAEVAKLLSAPVVLVIDAARISGSAAAIALGYRKLDPGLDLAGVVLNNLGGPKHLRWTAEAVERRAGIRVFGHLPRKEELRLPERHLGLVPAAEKEEVEEFLEGLAEQIEATVDVEGLLNLANSAPPLPEARPELFLEGKPSKVKLAVALDEAFNFYYQDNFDLLSGRGAELVFVSPLRDRGLPPDIRGVYLGGGFPEVYAEGLEGNEGFKRELKEAAEAGMPVYAECGGLMYLSEGIVDFEGRRYHMVGIIPGWAKMQRRRTRMGYATAEALRENILLSGGERVRGHMFHWSKFREPEEEAAAYKILEPAEQIEGFVLGPRSNVLASYLHLHFGSRPNLALRFVESCASWR